MKRISCALLLAGLAIAQQCPPAIQIDHKPQIFVMSDISNEPDDTQSFIRLLLHSDQYNITGMVATTSYWLNSTTTPDEILKLTSAYGKVVDNLNLHSDGVFPTEEYLTSIVRSGHPVYGTAAIGKPLSTGAERLIEVLDFLPDNETLHCQAWGGTNVLAEALSHVRSTRAQLDQEKFYAKIRVYAISDQDNSGVWIRLNFPQIPYIASIHSWLQYQRATWNGISGNRDVGGADASLVNNAYVKKNFQIGPLGSLYPDIAFIMEGDSPCFLHTMQNGLNGGPVDHPEWGGWGGRYALLDLTRQTMHYVDTTDFVVGKDNKTWASNHATIWRWRQAFQDEMSARVQWSVLGNSSSAGSHPPVVSVNGSCGSKPLEVDVEPGQVVTLDASGSYDPDANVTGKNELQFKWFHYWEITTLQGNRGEVPQLNFTLSGNKINGSVASTTLPISELACAAPPGLWQPEGVQEICQQYHVILEVTGSGTPPIRRYKRVILKVQPPAVPEGTRRKRDEL